MHTVSRLKPLIAKDGRSGRWNVSTAEATEAGRVRGETYLKDIPYCDTWSKPVFHTSVTSQAFVAWSRHDKKAETGFPPTTITFISSSSDMSGCAGEDACKAGPSSLKKNKRVWWMWLFEREESRTSEAKRKRQEMPTLFGLRPGNWFSH